MGNAAYIIFIMWNSIFVLDAWYNFRFNIKAKRAKIHATSVQCTVGQHVGVWLKTWIFTKSARVWHKVPGLGHILLVQWIFGKTLPQFDIRPMFVPQKLTKLEHF